MTKNELEISSDGSINIIKPKRNDSKNESSQRIAEDKAKRQKDSVEKISWFSRNVILPFIVAFIGVG